MISNKVLALVQNAKDWLDKTENAKATFNGSPQSDALLRHLCTKFHIFKSTFNATEGAIQFNEGQRTVILYLLKLLNKDEKELQRYIEEQEERKQS